jgi:hypothetical protein
LCVQRRNLYSTIRHVNQLSFATRAGGVADSLRSTSFPPRDTKPQIYVARRFARMLSCAVSCAIATKPARVRGGRRASRSDVAGGQKRATEAAPSSLLASQPQVRSSGSQAGSACRSRHAGARHRAPCIASRSKRSNEPGRAREMAS